MLAVALTAALGWFGTGLDPWWPLAWLAPLPVLLYAGGAPWRRAALVAASAWLIGMLGLWRYLHGELGLPGPAIALFLVPGSLTFAAGVLLYRALIRHGGGGAAVIGFAATRVAFEYLLAIVGPHGTAGSLAYTQVKLLPVLQLAALAGPWAITFAVTAVPAALAAAWQLRAARGQALRIAGTALAGLAAVLAFGVARLVGDASGPRVQVGLAASDPPTSPQLARAGAATTALLDQYARSAGALADHGAQLIVLPEKIGIAGDPGAADAAFQAQSDRTGAVIVVGVVHEAGSASANEARIYAPGEAMRAYHKHHLLPAFEPFAPGDALTVIPRPLGALGVQICKDMDFPALSRDYGRADVALMLVPAYDFGVDGNWHAGMAMMRGVESGFGVVRAAKHGRLTVSDSRGRVLAEAASNAAPFSTLIASVPSVHTTTLYQRWGDWFAWLALLGLLASIARLGRGRPLRG
jgi:apolipoprotein N-acyltransferase